ncbi:hypothetical protein [Companilactobacillus bobalius]|uniref:LPXTG cell wall anchor domain-containing protein n=2 Tax=Companilactobacillus bobalius TaxID=2801451 RepID=A0A202F803_9LACO|nr:hypothetical protein [Companilactobacillus bobalius]GEO58440.1 hypothetical protein LBO01_15690 [Companilactobacillus paralimentarius]KAE9557609.1 hypothetical protein ATN92_15775 [Companilactobacillus bobalius]KAE9563755.1 hypothetical protein ATN92_03225 [Companilactobacillus bobalius]KRK83502.1 hypothetical protein FC78_GL001458 [Companilactobacillus bobalius DSM 19674]OVE96585.1 hypothetical protein LKACC16343_02254 [Companilactobacillus bobalius]
MKTKKMFLTNGLVWGWILILGLGQIDIVNASSNDNSDVVENVNATKQDENIDTSSNTVHDFTIHLGDSAPMLKDFVNSDGDRQKFTRLDLTKVDLAKEGTYDVVVSTANGENVTVHLTILPIAPVKSTDNSNTENKSDTKIVNKSKNHVQPLKTTGMVMFGTVYKAPEVKKEAVKETEQSHFKDNLVSARRNPANNLKTFPQTGNDNDIKVRLLGVALGFLALINLDFKKFN